MYKSISNHLEKNQKYYLWFLGAAILSLLSMHSFAAAPAPGSDLLGGTQLDKTVDQTFGPGSTLMKVVYGAELFLGIIGYMKSKNPLVLIGIPVIMIVSAGLSTLIQ